LFQRDNKSNENITGLPEGSPFRIIGGNMELVSVIVPVYNVEKYLKKCVDSILSQSYQNIEVILINDGSLDGSGEICEAYAKKDERIKYITQNNSGLGKTRNRGIEEASGKYLLFVDSDDYIENTMIEKLYHNITESHADVASCGVYNVYRQKCIPQCEKEEKFLCDVEKAFGLLLVGEKIPGSSCNKLYRSELLDKVKFPEGVLYEDVKFHLDLMQIIQSVHVDTTPLYYYVHREESITTKKFDSSAMSFIYFYEETLKVVQQKYPSVITQARFKLFWAYFALLDRIIQQDDYQKIPEYCKIVRYLKRNTIRILKNPYFRKGRKVGALMLLINVRLYKLLVEMNEKKNKGIAS